MLWDFEKHTIYSSDVILRFTEAFNEGRGVRTMSGRSCSNNSANGNTAIPNVVRLAGEESKDKMYEPKHTKKLIRVLTVIAYIFSVSLAAIMLSVYYVFLWNPKDIPHYRSSIRAMPTPEACPQYPMANFPGPLPEDVVVLPQINDTTPTAPTDAAKFKSSSKMSLLNIMFPQLLSDTSLVSSKKDSILN